jgi:hypothetical protein
LFIYLPHQIGQGGSVIELILQRFHFDNRGVRNYLDNLGLLGSGFLSYSFDKSFARRFGTFGGDSRVDFFNLRSFAFG